MVSSTLRRERTVQIQSLVGIGGISDSALSSLLQRVRDLPEILEVPPTRRQINRAQRQVLDEVSDTIELAHEDGPFLWRHSSMQKLLNYYCRECPNFRNAILNCYRRHPCSKARPWNFVLYTDELVPGAELSHHNFRKNWAFYTSFREFEALVGREQAWLPHGYLRTDIVKKIPGGISEVARELCRKLCLSSSNFPVTGVPVRCGEVVIMVYATIGNILADEAALHGLSDMKGANGLICCICCLNVWQPDHWARKRPLVDPTGFMVDVSCSSPKEFVEAKKTRNFGIGQTNWNEHMARLA